MALKLTSYLPHKHLKCHVISLNIGVQVLVSPPQNGRSRCIEVWMDALNVGHLTFRRRCCFSVGGAYTLNGVLQLSGCFVFLLITPLFKQKFSSCPYTSAYKGMSSKPVLLKKKKIRTRKCQYLSMTCVTDVVESKLRT